MALSKQTAVEESYEEVIDQSQNGHDQNAVTPEQVCKTLQFLFQLARSKENKLNCLRIELLAKISIYSDEGLKKLKDDQKRLDEELKSTYGEITLITCPIETCLIHHPLNSNNTSNDNPKTNSDSNLVINPLTGYLPPEKLFRKRFTLILLFPSKMQQTSIFPPFKTWEVERGQFYDLVRRI
ncbi:hypothetical protein TNCV_3759271 [Trichonephila clavipes]|nr:hypothetical protein TNCV_3759271 [Trichonephila clavipes]